LPASATPPSAKSSKSVKLTCQCQNDAGGWRYQPVKSDADLSVTICQIMGLRAARDAGIHVPDEVRTRCIDYVKKSQNPDGGFRYQINGGGSTFPLTAAGVVSCAGIYDGEKFTKAPGRLMNTSRQRLITSYFFYGYYYAIHVAWRRLLAKWFPAIRDQLLSRQGGDGSRPTAKLPRIRNRHGLHHPPSQQIPPHLRPVGTICQLVAAVSWRALGVCPLWQLASHLRLAGQNALDHTSRFKVPALHRRSNSRSHAKPLGFLTGVAPALILRRISQRYMHISHLVQAIKLSSNVARIR
jgi:hypothetical protein